MSDKQILLGRILGPHGVKGEVKIKSFTADPLAVASYGAVSAPDGRRFKLTRARLQGEVVVAAIKGVTDRNVAETLKGLELSIARDDLPEPDEREFYQADLIGLAVFNEAGEHVGEVTAFQRVGASDLIEIAREGGGSSFIPFADSMVPKVDLDEGRITLSETGMAVLAADEADARKGRAP
jgi:16S rRNA processing protein RimM